VTRDLAPSGGAMQGGARHRRASAADHNLAEVPVKVPVLLYHDVQAVPRPGLARWTVTPEQFRQHLDVVAASGRVALTVSEFAACLRGERPLGAAVVVTFDDGYASTSAAVLELLDRGLGATVYITSGTVDQPGMLSSVTIGRLSRLDRIEIGAHSVSHPRLDELADDVLATEVTHSKRAIEAIVDAPVASFAYPHGFHDARARAAVIHAGYESAAAIKNAISHSADDPFAIARWTVTARTTPEDVGRIVRGEGAPLAWRRELLRTRAYRTLRRTRRRAATWIDERQWTGTAGGTSN
jgi:peptidoglycan/xylan/chitin deacetylase (PgdA/CDA1 family)